MTTETTTADQIERMAWDLGLPVERDPKTGETFVVIGGRTFRAEPVGRVVA